MNDEIPMVLGYSISEAEKILKKNDISFTIKRTDSTVKKNPVRNIEDRVLRVKQGTEKTIELVVG